VLFRGRLSAGTLLHSSIRADRPCSSLEASACTGPRPVQTRSRDSHALSDGHRTSPGSRRRTTTTGDDGCSGPWMGPLRSSLAGLLAKCSHNRVTRPMRASSYDGLIATDKAIHWSGWRDLNSRPLDPQTSAACPWTSPHVQFSLKIRILHIDVFRWTNPNGGQNGGQTHS
jgi:hypothetical protein